MKKYIFALLTSWVFSTQALTLPYSVNIPESSQQHYIVYQQSDNKFIHIVIVEVRGQHGSQFYAKYIDCKNQTHRYFASAPTWKQLMQTPARDENWFRWNPITKYYGYAICNIL